jgi:hypothetical protein
MVTNMKERKFKVCKLYPAVHIGNAGTALRNGIHTNLFFDEGSFHGLAHLFRLASHRRGGAGVDSFKTLSTLRRRRLAEIS